MSAPGNVTSYAPKGKESAGGGNGIGKVNELPAPEKLPLPSASDPAALAVTIEAAIGRIGDIAAAEMEATADDILEAAEHIAGQFRRLAAAMRQTSAGHGKAASDFCARMRTSYESVRTLSAAFEPPRAPAVEGQEAEPAAEPMPEKPIPKFLKDARK